MSFPAKYKSLPICSPYNDTCVKSSPYVLLFTHILPTPHLHSGSLNTPKCDPTSVSLGYSLLY